MSNRSNFKFNDFALSNRVYSRVQGGLRQHRIVGFFTDIITGIVFLFVGLGAFSVRVVLRSKLGERSFGVVMILLTYYWIRMFYLHDKIEINSCSEFEFMGGGCGALELILFLLLTPFYAIANIFIKDVSNISPIETTGGSNLLYLLNLEVEGSFAGYYSLIFLILSLAAIIEVFIGALRKIKWYSYHRGKSRIGLDLLAGKTIFGFFLIKDVHIWMIVEPILVALFASWFWISGDTILGSILFTGAVCLFLEEFSSARKEREVILDLNDQEFEAQYYSEIRNRYKSSDESHRDILKDQSNKLPEAKI